MGANGAVDLNCRHCGKALSVERTRGLCSCCYNVKEVRRLYSIKEPDSPLGRRIVTDFYGTTPPVRKGALGHRPLPVPTDACPGTAEKIEVMHARAVLGQPLFHPDDHLSDVERATRGLGL